MANLSPLDLVIIAAFMAASLALGLAFKRRGTRSLADYFVSGRSLPWWLAGTSMVATTFAADTPLAVSAIVAKEGISGNWMWWSFLPGGLATVFFFAALWHRAGVVTDVEFVSLRYTGRPAHILRVFRAVYLGVLMNGIIIGWVNLAMAKILKKVVGLDEVTSLGLCLVVTVAYSTLSGLWGIVTTDFLQFITAMAGTIALAVFGLEAAGGLAGIRSVIPAVPHPTTGAPYGSADPLLAFLPDPNVGWSIPGMLFAVYLGINWWSNWYPGSEPGGGGYVAQRLFATKNERHAVLAGLWFNLANFAIRPWPWILAGLAGIALYRNRLGEDGVPDLYGNYLGIMTDHLPSGWYGLLIAAFAAAYMSTISTQLNWGASYLINDVYRPYLRPEAEAAHYVRAGKVVTLVQLALSIGITLAMSTIEGAWKIVFGLGAGTGLVLILRWFWWRVNAWSEIVSMGAALVTWLVSGAIPGLSGDEGDPFAKRLILNLVVVTIAWVTATFLTRPEPRAHLEAFCRRVRPPGPGWRHIDPGAPGLDLVPRGVAWATGIGLVYGLLFGVGHALLGRRNESLEAALVAAVSALGLSIALRHPCFQDAATKR